LYLCIFVTKTQEQFMNPNNPFAGLKNKAVPIKPSHAGEDVDEAALPSKAPPRESRVGRPKEGRPKRVVAFTSDELYAWIERLEHTPRPDGSYFSSQAAVVNRLLEIAKKTLDIGREQL
jgi:hypothetical protein